MGKWEEMDEKNDALWRESDRDQGDPMEKEQQYEWVANGAHYQHLKWNWIGETLGKGTVGRRVFLWILLILAILTVIIAGAGVLM